MSEKALPESESVETKFGTVEVSKFTDPLGYLVKFIPTGGKLGHILDVGQAQITELEAVEQLEFHFTESFRMAGEPFDFRVSNSVQASILDALKDLCTGTRPEYVINKLKGIPR